MSEFQAGEHYLGTFGGWGLAQPEPRELSEEESGVMAGQVVPLAEMTIAAPPAPTPEGEAAPPLSEARMQFWAKPGCRRCHGRGREVYDDGRGNARVEPCDCVLRRMARGY